MKKTLLFILLFSFSFVTYAQITLENDTIVKSYLNDVDIPFDIEGHTIITNTSNNDIEITWTRIITEKTTTWSSAICIGVLCYAPNKDTETTTVPANGSIDLYFHTYPNGTCGMIDADVQISITSNGNIMGQGNYNYDVECSISTEELVKSLEVKLYPNPTDGFFKVNTSFDLNHFEVYNVVGRMIERVEGTNTLDINSYPKGIYLVKAFDSELRFTTVKLLKR